MTFKDLFFSNGNDKKVTLAEPEMEPQKPDDKFIEGTITHVNEKGYGFIISPEIKFNRIFFHWTALEQDTLNFTELKKRMRVSFIARKYQETGWRAIRIRVIQQ